MTEIRLHSTDRDINEKIRSLPEGTQGYTTHYDQNEDFFIQIGRDIVVPHFPIHHDVRETEPAPVYHQALTELVDQLAEAIPEVFVNLRYYFDPGDTLRPAFFQIYKVGDLHYLYSLKVDLKFRPHDAEIIERGTNDVTSSFRTSKIFLDATLIPIEEIRTDSDGSDLTLGVRQTISSTWIGETGRGYFVQGIWMDHELTKFFSKLFVPKGIRVYPYYPFVCRYRTFCHSVIQLSPEGRRNQIPNLHRALQFIAPEMPTIEQALHHTDFSEDLEVFQSIKAKVPPYWQEVFGSLKVKVYLNERDMKEFRIEA